MTALLFISTAYSNDHWQMLERIYNAPDDNFLMSEEEFQVIKKNTEQEQKKVFERAKKLESAEDSRRAQNLKEILRLMNMRSRMREKHALAIAAEIIMQSIKVAETKPTIATIYSNLEDGYLLVKYYIRQMRRDLLDAEVRKEVISCANTVEVDLITAMAVVLNLRSKVFYTKPVGIINTLDKKIGAIQEQVHCMDWQLQGQKKKEMKQSVEEDMTKSMQLQVLSRRINLLKEEK